MKHQSCILWRAIVVFYTVQSPVLALGEPQTQSMANNVNQSKPLHVRYLPKFSTLGKGFELSTSFSKTLQLRMERYILFRNTRSISTLINIRSNFDITSHSLLLDWRPYSGLFRTTIGISTNSNHIKFSATNNQTISINAYELISDGLESLSRQQNEDDTDLENSYSDEDIIELLNALNIPTEQFSIKSKQLVKIKGKVRLPNIMPYLGIGWSRPKSKFFKFGYSVDAGVLFPGKADVDFSVDEDFSRFGRKYFPDQYDEFIERGQKKLEKQLRRYKYLPFFSIGVSYDF